MAPLEHIGIAVRDPEAARRLFGELFGLSAYKTETVEHEGVRTHFLAAGGVKLELLEALGPDSPVARHLERRGEGLHHLAFEVDDVEAAFRRARELGFEPLADAPRDGADGKRIFFLHPKQTGGVLVEFCQSTGALPPPRRVRFHEGSLAAYTYGDPGRPALLLLHGADDSGAAALAPLARALEPAAFVVTYDLPGYGASEAVPGTTGAAAPLPQSALAVLDGLSLPAAHLFGHALGAEIALRTAAAFPQRVLGVFAHGFVAALEHAGAFAAGEDVPWWAAVGHPVLLSAGDRDPHVSPAELLAVRDALPNAAAALLPGVGPTLVGRDVALYAHLVRARLDRS